MELDGGLSHSLFVGRNADIDINATFCVPFDFPWDFSPCVNINNDTTFYVQCNALLC